MKESPFARFVFVPSIDMYSGPEDAIFVLSKSVSRTFDLVYKASTSGDLHIYVSSGEASDPSQPSHGESAAIPSQPLRLASGVRVAVGDRMSCNVVRNAFRHCLGLGKC